VPRQHRLCLQDLTQAEPDTGYRTLIFDGMIGDTTLFQRADKLAAGCKPFNPS
jgi:glucose-6-phosphate 1-dehydrogenase